MKIKLLVIALFLLPWLAQAQVTSANILVTFTLAPSTASISLNHSASGVVSINVPCDPTPKTTTISLATGAIIVKCTGAGIELDLNADTTPEIIVFVSTP